MQQPPQTMKQRVILVAFVAAAILISVAVHYAQKSVKDQQADSQSADDPAEMSQKKSHGAFTASSLKTADGRKYIFSLVMVINRRESMISVRPAEYPQEMPLPGMGYGHHKGLYISLHDDEELPAEKHHIYFIADGKIQRDVPYAEAGLPDSPLFEEDNEVTENKYREDCIEKLKTYLETHADEIFGEKPAEDQEEPQV